MRAALARVAAARGPAGAARRTAAAVRRVERRMVVGVAKLRRLADHWSRFKKTRD